MNDLSEIPFIVDHKAWYFFSVYYARENWPELIVQINHFFRAGKDPFCACLISFSEDKGERVDISLASSPDQENRKDEIDRFFLSFVEKFPSTRKTSFPYGKAIWGNYPNNTLLWVRFRKINVSDQYADFHSMSFRFALSLIENDTSPDTLFSVCLYLITKGLSCIEPDKQKPALFDALHEVSIDFKNYGHVDSVKNLIAEHIDLQEICFVLASYWNENESEFSPELKTWLANTKGITGDYGYNQYCSYICKMFGLKGLHQMMLLEPINIWYNSHKMRIENE